CSQGQQTPARWFEKHQSQPRRSFASRPASPGHPHRTGHGCRWLSGRRRPVRIRLRSQRIFRTLRKPQLLSRVAGQEHQGRGLSMVATDGATTPALTPIARNIREYSMFQGVQLVLERLRHAHPDLDDEALYERLELQANPSMGFPGSEI